MKKRMHIVVQGRVQGVCYRMCAQDEAGRLGISGWVRNRPEGSVEIVAEGSETALAKFLAWCREGPSYARVLELDHSELDATGEFDGFEVRY